MAEITFFAAECMEFPERLGELRENLTLPEAVNVYMTICERNGSYGPGIGFVLRDESIPDYSGIKWPFYQGREIDVGDRQLCGVQRRGDCGPAVADGLG